VTPAVADAPLLHYALPGMNSMSQNECGTPLQGSKTMERIKIEQHSVAGCLWFASWLFTIGFLHLTFWKGVLALFIWPYYIGAHLSSILH
jgi:hypothetical protein